MVMNYSIKEENGVYQIMKGKSKVKTPRKSPVSTGNKDLAEWLLWEFENEPDVWNHLFSVRFLHFSYCDMPEISDEDKEQTKEWVKNAIEQDPFWAFNEPMKNRALVVARYLKFLPDLIMDMPHHMFLSFINWANMTGSIILPLHILNTLLDEASFYSLDDMDEFVEELIEYGNDMDIQFFASIPWEEDYLAASIRTLVNYCNYSEV